jgi:hypothetical protein
MHAPPPLFLEPELASSVEENLTMEREDLGSIPNEELKFLIVDFNSH